MLGTLLPNGGPEMNQRELLHWAKQACMCRMVAMQYYIIKYSKIMIS